MPNRPYGRIGLGGAAIKRKYALCKQTFKKPLGCGSKLVAPSALRHQGDANSDLSLRYSRGVQRLLRFAVNPRQHSRVRRGEHQFGEDVRIENNHDC